MIRYMVDKKASRDDKKLVNIFGGNKKGCTFAIERWLDLNVRLFPPTSNEHDKREYPIY